MAGRLEEATTATRRFLADRQDDGAAWQLLGLIERRRNLPRLARAALETACLLIPLSAEGRFALADSYQRTGCEELGRSMLCDLCVADDVPASLLPKLAAAMGQLGDFERAANVCRRAALAQPGDDRPLYGLAYYLRKLGRPSACILRVMRSALELKPDCLAYRVSVAMLTAEVDGVAAAYAVVKSLSGEDLGRIRCASCVGRLQDLFVQAGDRAGSRRCADRLAVLTGESRNQNEMDKAE